ncbi:transmembrane channel-like protein 5 isoform X2 [Lineus longissimus]|uniref:transmembrane channel-like protein 5 isoform X2 n=1 Tax=Lineus longissimus TaxID=88925 RepID=UPI002B4D4768
MDARQIPVQQSPGRARNQGSPSRSGYYQPSPSGSGHQQSPQRHQKNGGENIPLEQIDHVNPGFEEAEGPWDNNIDNNGNAELRHRKPNIYRQSSAPDANDLLSMMPSRHKERGLSRKHATANDDIHRSATRKKLQRQNTMYQTLRGKPDEDVLDSIIQDIGTDPKMTASDVKRDDHIRSIPTNLTNRKTIRRRVSNFDRTEVLNVARPGTLKRVKYNMQLGFRTVRLGIRDTLYRFDLWHSHLHLIEGHFGTGVVSYFTFLRTLLFLNIPVFLLSVSFIIIPQMLYRFYQQDPTGYVSNQNFTGRELLTGAGWFEATEMYYGSYINGTINVFSGHSNGSWLGLTGLSYDMAYAYLLTSGGFYLLCLLILARSLARSYRKNFIEASGEVAYHYMGKVLCGWDFSINQPNTAKLKHKAIYNELKEYLSSSRKEKKKRTCGQICCLVFLRTVTNLLVLALIGGSGYLIWYISITRSIQNDIDVLSEMAMPLCISAFNLILPIAFSIIGAVEQWERPKVELYLTMLRTISLKGVNLGVLIFFWYKNVSCTTPEDKSQYTKNSRCIGCWETFMGEEIYRLVIVDFIVSLLVTFVAEFLRSVMAKGCCKLLGSPEFEIGRNTLNLIYSQALCWLGHFYCPVLSFIQIIKLVVIFYVKRLSVMMNCVPSQKPWRAARAHTIFLGYLFCAYFMMCSSLAVSIILIKPSASCGPFRGLERPYDVILVLLDHVKEDHSIIDGILSFISSQGFIAACIVALCIGAYYLRMLGKTRYQMIGLLKHQVQLEGKDKVFLLRMYQEISKDIGGGLPSHKPLTVSDVQRDPSPNPTNPATADVSSVPVDVHQRSV